MVKCALSCVFLLLYVGGYNTILGGGGPRFIGIDQIKCWEPCSNYYIQHQLVANIFGNFDLYSFKNSFQQIHSDYPKNEHFGLRAVSVKISF